jgi:2-phospho-L-lactate guanylyltransferase
MRAALVPVGALSGGKSRLAGELPRAAMEALIGAMLEDVLAALRASPALDAVAVVTPDPEVARLARTAGARALRLDVPGLNPSIDAASAALCAEGADALLVVLGDVAGIGPADVDALFAALDALGGRGAVLAPARDGGTAALLRAPPDVLPSRFGPASALAHEQAARERGVPFHALARPALAVDVDRPEDLDALLASGSGAPRTRALLARLRAEARA